MSQHTHRCKLSVLRPRRSYTLQHRYFNTQAQPMLLNRQPQACPRAALQRSRYQSIGSLWTAVASQPQHNTLTQHTPFHTSQQERTVIMRACCQKKHQPMARPACSSCCCCLLLWLRPARSPMQ